MWRDIERIIEKMERDIWETLHRILSKEVRPIYSHGIRNWEVQETDDEVQVIIEMPGAKKETIDIEVIDQKIVVKGETYNTQVHFEFELTNIDPDTIIAKYNNGILTISAKKKEASGRKIEVE